MFKITILSCFFIIITGKMIKLPDNSDFNDVNDIEDDSSDYYYDSPANFAGTQQNGDVWFLNLKDDWKSLKLQNADEERIKEFYALNGFLIQEYRLHQIARKMLRFFKPKPEPLNVPNSKKNETITEKKYNLVEAQQHLWQIINKIMIHDEEAGMDLTDAFGSGVKMELFFKGPYSALIVTMKKNLWNFFIAPPSLLSTWFAEVHKDSMTATKTLELPENIKELLFRHLMKLLLLSYSLPN